MSPDVATSSIPRSGDRLDYPDIDGIALLTIIFFFVDIRVWKKNPVNGGVDLTCHKKTMRQFYETSQKPYGLILEDDAVPTTTDRYTDEVREASPPTQCYDPMLATA